MRNKVIHTMACMFFSCVVCAKIPSFVGDVVGRDLSGAGPLGHVGIVSAPDYRMKPTVVLEAMSSVPHIQENTIEDFKSRSKFWGSKGGLLSPKSIESYTVANRIIRQYYACPEYTITWKWKEGQIDSNSRPISCARFRCDTLVNYAYAFHRGYSLPTYNTTWTTPLAIYNYFPVESNLLLSASETNQSTSKNIISDDISLINENNLSELSSENFYQIIQNSPSISSEKIKYLWKLFTSNDVNDDVKILFYDFISFENLDGLTHDIIRQAKNESGELRHKLLVTLQSIYQRDLEKNKEKDLKAIIDYFKELQFQKLDKNDGGIVYRGLATLAPNSLKTQNINLTNMDKIHVSILRLKSDRANEIKYVNNIIYNLEHPDDGLVITASYQYLTQLLINSDLKFFSNESKQLFKNHLNHQLMINGSQLVTYASAYTSAYIEFKAVLNSNYFVK